MKYLVQTTGAFMLSDAFGGQIVEAYRPCVVVATTFIETSIGNKLEKLDVLTDDAEDSSLASARTAEELTAAIAALPRPKKAEPKTAEEKPAPRPTPPKK